MLRSFYTLENTLFYIIMLCIHVFDVLIFFRAHQHFFIFLINTDKENYNENKSFYDMIP